jgi:hypothetical protein
MEFNTVSASSHTAASSARALKSKSADPMLRNAFSTSVQQG